MITKEIHTKRVVFMQNAKYGTRIKTVYKLCKIHFWFNLEHKVFSKKMQHLAVLNNYNDIVFKYAVKSYIPENVVNDLEIVDYV